MTLPDIQDDASTHRIFKIRRKDLTELLIVSLKLPGTLNN